jgi:hypothetical protein
MIQALAKHVEQLVALPDELRETAICKYKRLCDSCGCHNERELAACLAAERRPRADPIARLIRACGQLQAQIKLPACFSLGVAGRDTSWQALLMHLRMQASAPGASEQLIEDVDAVGCSQDMGSHPAPLSPQRSPSATAASFRVQLWAGAGKHEEEAGVA